VVVQSHVATQVVIEGDEQNGDGDGSVAGSKPAGGADMVFVSAV